MLGHLANGRSKTAIIERGVDGTKLVVAELKAQMGDDLCREGGREGEEEEWRRRGRRKGEERRRKGGGEGGGREGKGDREGSVGGGERQGGGEEEGRKGRRGEAGRRKGGKGGGGEGIEDQDISSDLELWYHIGLGFRSPTLMASNRTGMLSVWKRTSRGVPLSQSSSPRM